MDQFTSTVVIVGGGPAGIAAAYQLGKSQVPTILIDKKQRENIGRKVCGDALGYEEMQVLETDYDFPLPRIETGELQETAKFLEFGYLSRKQSVAFEDPAYTVDRRNYGQALLEIVSSFPSVKVLPDTKLISLIVNNNRLNGISVLHHGSQYTINCKVIVDASGTTASVRKKVPSTLQPRFPQKIAPHQMSVAFREIIKTKQPHHFQKTLYISSDQLLKELNPGYFWIFSKGPNLVNVGGGWLLRPQNKGKNIRNIIKNIRNEYFDNEEIEIVTSQGEQIPARLPLPSLVANGIILTGDAAALVNPINGEGHAPALISGVWAAETIIQAMENEDYSEQSLWDYNKRIWNHFGVRHSIGVAMLPLIEKYGFEAFYGLFDRGMITGTDISNRNEKQNFYKYIFRGLKLLHRPRLLLSIALTARLIQKLQHHASQYPSDDKGFVRWNDKLNKLLG